MVDEAIADFWGWVEAKKEERTIGKTGKQPGKGQTWVPKYESIGDILAEYGHDEADDTTTINSDMIAALADELDAITEAEF